MQLQVPNRALEEVPARALALLAVRNYLESQTRRRLTIGSILWSVVVVVALSPLLFGLGNRLLHRYGGWALKFLLLIPLDIIWSWRKHLPSVIDRVTLEQTRDGERFIEAMELALQFDVRAGVPASFLEEMLARVNILRTEYGYPELALKDGVLTLEEEAESDES